MKWKIILRFEMHGAKTHRGAKPTLRNREIIPRIKELGLKQTAAEAWCSDGVDLEVAAKKLPEILRIFADPRSIKNTSGELGYLFLYIERSNLN
jgi:hypothetical protein